MDESVILNTPIILFISFIALLLLFSLIFIKHKIVGFILQVLSFLCVLGCITYALLLGVELTELLVYVLAFMLLNMITFVTKDRDDVEYTQKSVTEFIADKQDTIFTSAVDDGNNTDIVNEEGHIEF